MIPVLAAACREHLLREKIVVAPSLAIGHQIADAIAHAGTPWVNLRIETIRTLADAVAGFALAGEGVTVLSRAQALALVERACDRVLDSSSYFAALADRPGLHRAIQRSIEDLGHAGLAPADLRVESFEDARKAADLARILEAYLLELREGKFVDRLGVVRRAISMLGSGAARPWAADALWFVIDDVELSALEERFLRAACGTWEMVGAASSEPGNRVRFRQAVGEENEVRAAFRSILAAGESFDDAELVYTARDPYLPLIYELAAEYEVPCTFAEGIAAPFTRPGQAALAFLDWIGNGWHASALRPFAGPHMRILRQAAIGWGRERYLPRIDAFLASRDPERHQRTIAQAQETRKFAARLLEITASLESTVASTARACAHFISEFGAPRNEVDGMARDGLRRLFEELSVLPSGETATGEITRRLTQAIRALHVSASNPRPGFLHVAPVRAGGWSARSRMFVAGLDEQRHPGSGLQDPVLLDTERVAIGVPIAGDRPERVHEQFRRLLSRSSSRDITLSWSIFGLRDRRERFPSTAVLDVYRESSGNREATHADLVGDRAGFVDPQPLSDSEWWLLRRCMDRDTRLREAILAAYPSLASGARAEEARDGAAITEWDGKVEAPPQELDPRHNGRVYSASQLEMMAGCPYRYFLERVLGIRPLDEIEFEPDTWLEAHQFGTLLHDVLQKTMEELCAANEKPSLAFLPRMTEIGTAALAEWRETIPPPSETAFERRRAEVLESAEIFLRTEEEACRLVTPKHFELAFDKFRLNLGGGRAVELRGRIDRVDHDEEKNEWHVWDYKSGSTYAYDRGGRLQCGTKIQHAIYARAVEDLLGGRVTTSGYLFPTPRGAGARLPRECSDAELKDALNLLFDTIATGWFPHGGADACKFCDFKMVCGGAERAAARADRKLDANADDPATRAWLRLQEVK